jgi:hypothetical protein
MMVLWYVDKWISLSAVGSINARHLLLFVKFSVIKFFNFVNYIMQIFLYSILVLEILHFQLLINSIKDFLLFHCDILNNTSFIGFVDIFIILLKFSIDILNGILNGI